MKCNSCLYYPKCFDVPVDEAICGDFKEKRLHPEIPCMVGTKVYVINRKLKRIFEYDVIGVHVGYEDERKNHLKILYKTSMNGDIIRKYLFRHLGRVVFLTKEEAEQALQDPAENE